MKHSNLKLRFARLAGSVGTVFLLGGFMTSCTDEGHELLTGQPSWLGESIYAELEARGNFKQTLKLINAQSEDYTEILKRTGSRTLFVADDEAWEKFFQNNPWGVKSIEDLSEAQKKLLFKGNMLNSAYLVDLLGNLPATGSGTDALPEEGSCMRRASSVDLTDSVPVVWKKDYPEINPARLDLTDAANPKQIDYWERLRDQDSAIILQDNSVASMIHFMPKFMLFNGISSDDVKFMTNGEITSNEGAFVNGMPIRANKDGEINHDITCQNGYIHIVDKVPVPLDNMANIIANNPNFSIYKRLLDRFSYPHLMQPGEDGYYEMAQKYGNDAKFYVKRYFNDHGSHGFTTRDVTDGGQEVKARLPYDPGWNRFIYESSNPDLTYQTDAAAMIVPTDKAMMEYLEGGGADLASRYGKKKPTDSDTAWFNCPDDVILPLLRNTMLGNSTFKSAIPSQFGSINNTVSDPMGVSKDHINHTHWACNGIVYESNRVHGIPEYVSVYYPCIIRSTVDLRGSYTVINSDSKVQGGEGFYAYLNNTGSKYTFVIPADDALQTYYDPVSYKRTAANGSSNAISYDFYVDEKGFINAYPHDVDWSTLDENGLPAVSEEISNIKVTSHTSQKLADNAIDNTDVFNHYKDIINSSIYVNEDKCFEWPQRFYTSKANTPIIVQWEGEGEDAHVVGLAGSFQYERGYYIPVTLSETFNKMQDGGNGCSYIIHKEPLMSTFVSPMAALTSDENYDKFGVFGQLLSGMDCVKKDDGNNHVTMDNAITLLNNYHYTIYAPTNESLEALIDDHKMPTWDDIDMLDNFINGIDGNKTIKDDDPFKQELDSVKNYVSKEMADMKSIISNFITYHIQDNALYIDGEPTSMNYETQCLDTLTSRFKKVYVDYTQGGKMTIKDQLGNTRTVDTSDKGNYNILTRQYYFNGKTLSGTTSTQIHSTSSAVIHRIDGPLLPYANCFYSAERYEKVMDILDTYAEYATDGAIKIKRHRK